VEEEERWPFASIVVATYNRGSLLPYLFMALAVQTYPADRAELIIIDDGSDDDTEAVVRRWAAVIPFPLQFRRQERKGPSAARNLGASAAHGDILAFTDSDCIPAPVWLRSGVLAFSKDVGIVCGPLLPKRRVGGPGFLSSQVDKFLGDTGLYPTANLFVGRAAFEAVGGFDGRFGLYPGVMGEDTDLAWRVRRMGYRARFSPPAEVGHLATPLTLRAWLLRPLLWDVLPRLLRSIPELRRTRFWHRYFVVRSHFYFQIAWVGVVIAATTRSLVPAALVVPWFYSIRAEVFARLRRGSVLKAFGALLLLVVRSSLGTLVLIVASIRHRRLLL
jgi:glycosyltransferase involved in cell wall biosynthesis